MSVTSEERSIEIRESTVARPAGYWSPAVHAFLDHLQRQGFDGAPRPIDLAGLREVLTFVPGETPGEDHVTPWTGDDQLASVGRLIRRFHDAAATFVPPDWARWQSTSVPTEGTRICHADLFRGNVVFRDGVAVGLIDFDFAHPADPIWDVAIAAWHWIPLSERMRCDVPAERWPERLSIFLDAYGVVTFSSSQVLACVERFLRTVRRRAAVDGRDTTQPDRDLQVFTARRSELGETTR